MGNFEEAITWEQKAIKSGLKDNDLKESRIRLDLYKQKEPFRILLFPEIK
jgi:hypothetical protein